MRDVYVTQEVHGFLEPEWGDAIEERKAGELRGDFDNFTAGRRLLVTLRRRPGREDLKRLEKAREEIWELKSKAPPEIRVFGRFADRDVFIALTFAWRDHIQSDGDFDYYKSVAKRQWRLLFPSHEPFTGVRADDYVSNATVV